MGNQISLNIYIYIYMHRNNLTIYSFVRCLHNSNLASQRHLVCSLEWIREKICTLVCKTPTTQPMCTEMLSRHHCRLTLVCVNYIYIHSSGLYIQIASINVKQVVNMLCSCFDCASSHLIGLFYRQLNLYKYNKNPKCFDLGGVSCTSTKFMWIASRISIFFLHANCCLILRKVHRLCVYLGHRSSFVIF